MRVMVKVEGEGGEWGDGVRVRVEARAAGRARSHRGHLDAVGHAERDGDDEGEPKGVRVCAGE